MHSVVWFTIPVEMAWELPRNAEALLCSAEPLLQGLAA